MSEHMYDDFRIAVAFTDDRPVIGVTGEVDTLTAPDLAGVLNALVDAGHVHLTVDLGEVRFMDAAGVAVLTSVAVRLRGMGGAIALVSVPAQTRRVLDVTDDGGLFVYEAERRPDTPPAGDDVVPAEVPAHRQRSSTDVVDASLRLITALADATVDNADGVSVTLERHGHLMTVAASNDAVLTMDHHQYATGEGPCLAAKDEGRWYYIESLGDETRWPTFVPLALEQGIHSILSSPLMTEERPQGALNIYSSKERAFGTREQKLAALFADQASEILTTAGAAVTDEQSNQRYADALSARQRIHQAQGMLMALDRLTADAAAASLHRAARAEAATVLEYATRLVTSTGPDGREA